MKLTDVDSIELNFKYFHYISTLFILSFVLSNILAVKIATVYGFTMPAGMVTFPLSYILSDILTEVYGFKRARQLIWFAIICEIMVVIFSRLAIALPPSTYWAHQEAFLTVLGPEWRIVTASCIAYLLGDYTNCYIIAKLKIYFNNKFMMVRFIGSTAVGVLIDNAAFTIIAFTGVLPPQVMIWLILGQYIIKVIYETIMSPISVMISTWLKSNEKFSNELNTTSSQFNFSKAS